MKDVLAHIQGHEAVLLNLKNSTYFGLNEVGVRVWELLEAKHSRDEILSSLLEEYDVDAATLKNDLDRLFADLSSAGLVGE